MKLLIGLISYKDLELMRQVVPVLDKLRREFGATFAVIDNGWDRDVRDFFEKEFPGLHYFRHEGGNLGFGAAHQAILDKFPGHDLYLGTTNDVLLNGPAVAKMLRRFAKSGAVLASGKLHYWDLESGEKTQKIDSLGMLAQKRHHFYERGAGELDQGQYDAEINKVFGVSGASFVVKTAVLEELGTLFDPRMWMYKEDVDLNYKLRWLGKEIDFYKEVWGWHARVTANRAGEGARALLKAQRGKRAYARKHSYRNHLLMLKNNLSFKLGFWVLFRVLIYEKWKAFFMFFRHPLVYVSGLWAFLTVPAQRVPRRVPRKEILKHFE